MAPGSPTPHGALTDPITTEDATVNVAGRLLLRVKIEFPIFAGGFIYLTDQAISGVTSESRITEWGEAVVLMDGGEDSLSLTVSNVPMASVMPGFGSTTKFSDYWNATFPPEGAKVTFEVSVLQTPLWEPYFVGAITEVSGITDRTVTLEISDISTKFYRDIGDPITRAEWPQAADAAVDRIKPIALGSVKAFTPPKVRERQRATLRTPILASDTISVGTPKDVTVDSNKKWPTTGQLKIDDEHFLYDNTVITGEKTIRLTGRAQNSTTAATHTTGKLMMERAQESWLIVGHIAAGAVGTGLGVAAQGGITGIYGLGDNDELVPLDSGLFTVTNVAGKMLLTTTSLDGITISTPSANPTFRRIDMDTAPSLFGFGSLPAGLFSNGTVAKNPEFAAGAMNQWRPDNYAVLNFKSRDSLAVKRTNAFTTPGAAPEKTWLGIEYFGLSQFGFASKLIFAITESSTSLVVANLSNLGPLADMGTTVGSPGIVYVAIEKEILAVTSWVGLPGEPGQTTMNIARGQLGTTAAAHLAEVEVRLYAVANTGFPVEEAIYFPQAYLLAQQSGGGLASLGKLTDISDVPAEIVEKDKGYVESQSLEAFHTHAIAAEDMPRWGKVYNQSSFFNGTQWFQDSFAADLIVSKVLDSTAGSFTGDQWALNSIQQVQMEVGYSLPSGGVGFAFSPGMGFQASTQQRITAMRFRIAHSGTASIKVALYLPDPNTSGDTKFKEKTFTGGGNFPAAAYGLDIDFFKCRFDASTGYPDGLKVGQLLTKHTLLQIDPVGGTPIVWSVTVDMILDDQQLVRGGDSVEFLGDRTLVTTWPSMAYCDSGPYSNGNQYPGPLTDVPAGNTNGYTSTKIIVPWLHGTLQPAVSQNTGAAAQQIRNSVGGKPGMVILNTDTSSTNEEDVNRAHLLIMHPSGPGDARVYRLTMLGAGTGRNTCGTPIVLLVNKKDGAPFSLSPNSQSAGPYTSHASENYSRRCWRWQWDLEQQNISVSKLCSSYFISITAGGTGAGGVAALEAITFLIETDKGRSRGAVGTDAQEYTRVQYFDASSVVSNYSDVLGKQVELRLAKQGFDFLPGKATFGASDGYRPILVARIFWVFKYTGTESRELDDIAVDFTGYSLLAGFHGANTIAGVLVNGPPLLSATLADVDTTSLVTASYPFGPTGPIGLLPLQGVIDEKIGARELINALCEQAQVSGFWELGKFTVSYKYPTGILPGPSAVFDYAAGEIQEDSIQVVRRPKDTVANVVKVSSLPAFARGGFRETSSLKAPASLAKYAQRIYEVDADFLEATYAPTLAKQVLQYRKEPETVIRFQTTISGKARALKRGQVIQVVNSPITAANSARLEVVAINKGMGTLESGIPLYEVECVERPNVSDEAPYP